MLARLLRILLRPFRPRVVVRDGATGGRLYVVSGLVWPRRSALPLNRHRREGRT